MRVKTTKKCFRGGRRLPEGSIINVEPEEFSSRFMVKIEEPKKEPKRRTAKSKKEDTPAQSEE